MPLTPAQLATLKADIAASGDLNSQPQTTEGATVIVAAYTLPAVPDFWVYKTHVTTEEIGDNIHGPELAGLTTAKTGRLQAIALFSPNGINPSIPGRRAFFDEVF